MTEPIPDNFTREFIWAMLKTEERNQLYRAATELQGIYKSLTHP